MIRIHGADDVLTAALRRIRWLWDEFGGIAVSVSGGKDSTVVMELALMVAKERGEATVPVFWLDQEAEYASTVDYLRGVFHRPDVEPYWMQVPFRLFNTTTHGDDQWLHVWGPGEPWMRDREPDSYHDNIYGTDRFKKLLHAVADHHFPGRAVLTGMRLEESPNRMFALAGGASYKWVTWGRKNRRHINFAPLYDWGWRDIWKAIHAHGWAYNAHYEAQYRYGVSISEMRVSNFHHETAVSNLWSLQEIEPDTYERAVQRLGGIQTAALLGREDWLIYKLPFMFDTWEEYRDFLLERLVEPDLQPLFRAKFAEIRRTHPWSATEDPKQRLVKAEVRAVIANDWEFVGFINAVVGLPKHHRQHDRQWRTA